MRTFSVFGGDTQGEGLLAVKWLDRNEVEFGRENLRCLIFPVFRMSDSLHGCVRQRKIQNRILSLAYTSAQPVRLTARQERHRKFPH
ncbi:MAG: hypothetical protein ACI4HI_03745, partial [Lachnospiraceae bacterium]